MRALTRFRAAAPRRTTAGRGSAPSRPSLRRSGLLGVLAGAIGLGCCVYPVVLVLIGAATATVAVDLGNRLFVEWGWAFKLAGAVFALTAIGLQWRRARACSLDGRVRVGRNVLVVAGAGLATYAVLYALTTALGGLAT